MKIEIDEEERERLIKAVIDDLTEEDRVAGRVKWGGFGTNPIQRAFKTEMEKQLRIVITDLLDNDEFREKLAVVGKLYLQSFFERDTDEIAKFIDQMMFDEHQP